MGATVYQSQRLEIVFCGKMLKKKLRKKNTSDTINSAMPQRNPSSVIEVCSP